MRHDMFTTIHKAIRNHLFDLARDAARIDLGSTAEIDALVAKIDHALGFLEEHAHEEDLHIFPAVRTVAPELAQSLAADHRALDVVAIEVERAAHELAEAEPSERPQAGAQLARMLNHMLALQLVHMGREETEVNTLLWGALDDVELARIHRRILQAIPPERMAEWAALMAPALSAVERRAILG